MTRYAASMKRAGLLAASLVATATLAHADKKLQDLTPGFVKEAASCVVEARGLTHIVGGVATLASTLQGDDKAALDADLATLTAANARVTTWCTALDEIVAFLQVNEAAPYKRVQRELDGKYRAVVAARTAAKKSLTDITPVTRAVIPRIKRTATEAPVPTAAATAFPSKRAVVLPRLPGSWTVSGSQTSDTATYADYS